LQNKTISSRPLRGNYQSQLPKWTNILKLTPYVRLENSSALCECGEEQTMDHLLECYECLITCSEKDLMIANQRAIDMAKYWLNFT
jgi:hypothetical protein